MRKSILRVALQNIGFGWVECFVDNLLESKEQDALKEKIHPNGEGFQLQQVILFSSQYS